MSVAKRPKVAFASDEEMLAADTESYGRWQAWRDHEAVTAVPFLSRNPWGVSAAIYHSRLTRDGLDFSGVDLLAQWAAPSVDTHKTLLYLSLLEKATGLSLDVTDGEWKVETSDWPPDRNDEIVHESREETHLRRQIEECERRLADLQGPTIPSVTLAALNQFASASLPWVWQRDAVLALAKYAKAEDPQLVRAGRALAEDVWRLLFCLYQSGAPVYHVRPQGPVPQSSAPRPPGGPRGACFRCGLFDHWARNCAVARPFFGQQTGAQAPPPLRLILRRRPLRSFLRNHRHTRLCPFLILSAAEFFLRSAPKSCTRPIQPAARMMPWGRLRIRASSAANAMVMAGMLQRAHCSAAPAAS